MIRVPIDLTAEQKTVMALFSIRQFLIVVPAATITLFQLFLFDWPFISGWLDFVARIAFFVVVNGVTLSLAFIRINKYDLYLSDFLLIYFKFKKSKKIYTN